MLVALLLLLADPVSLGIQAFQQGRIAESLQYFDNAAKIDPSLLPHLWQRGISLYYLGSYADCEKQFALHRTVNPDDVENSAWWYLCAERNRRGSGRYNSVTGDSRAPMAAIDALFAGKASVDDLQKAARGNREAQFYADLYTGLWYEAKGDCPHARQYVSKAASSVSSGHYMVDVARIHANSKTCRP